MARLRHCILKPMPASRGHEEATEELLWVAHQRSPRGFRRRSWSASQSNFGRDEREEGRGNRCVLVLYEWVSSSEYVVHMHRHSPCFYCSTITTTAQACRTACTSEASSRSSRPVYDTNTSLKPCLQLADLASTLMATNWKSKNHVRDDNKGFLAFF